MSDPNHDLSWWYCRGCGYLSKRDIPLRCCYHKFQLPLPDQAAAWAAWALGGWEAVHAIVAKVADRLTAHPSERHRH